MWDKFILWLKSKFTNYLTPLERLEAEYKNKQKILEKFILEDLLNSGVWAGTTVILNGKINYFLLANGEFPELDAMFPDKGLIILLGRLGSIDWEEARRQGLTKDEWQSLNNSWNDISSQLQNLCYLQGINLWIIPWESCHSTLALKGSFTRLYVGENSA